MSGSGLDLLKQAEWWTKTAVALLDAKPGTIAEQLSKLVGKNKDDLNANLKKLYVETFKNCAQSVLSDEFFCGRAENFDFSFLNEVAPSKELVFFDPMFPCSHPFYSRLLDKTGDRLAAERAFPHEYFTEFLRIMKGRFGRTLNETRAINTDKYKISNDYIELVQKLYDTDEGRHIEHVNDILDKVGAEPLGLDPDLTLHSIYVTPSANRQTMGRLKNPKDREGADKPQQVESLMADVLERLEDKEPRPIIIVGQPGHGKTSAMRMLVHAICAKERLEQIFFETKVLFYEFKNLGRLDDNEITVLNNRTKFVREKEFFFGKNTVIILDALDEFQAAEGQNGLLKTFAGNIFGLARDINKRQDGSRLQLIFTGRTQFVESVRDIFSGEYIKYEIDNFSDAHIEKWLQNFNAGKKLDAPLSAQSFKKYNLGELYVQPVLLHMCALMLSDEKGIEAIKTLEKGGGPPSRGEIYEKIIIWTHDKRWHKDAQCFSANPDDFMRFLEALAAVIFWEKEDPLETGRVIAGLKKHEEKLGLKNMTIGDQKKIEEALRKISIAFFFEGQGNNAISFIHKTFQDFLTVEAIFGVLCKAAKRFDEDSPKDTCRNMADLVYSALGGCSLSYGDHLGFLLDIPPRRKPEAIKLLKPLVIFFQGVMRHEFLLDHARGLNTNPLETEANVLYGLHLVIMAIWFSLSKVERSEAGFDEEFFNLFGDRKNGPARFVFLNHSEKTGWAIIFGAGADLRGAYLSGAYLSHAYLSGACLSGAYLSRAYLSSAILMYADLSGANLSGANLSGAYLFYAKFCHANLSGANLSNAKLRGADFSEANLLGANLAGADLRNAKLGDADLSYTQISRKYEAHISSSKVKGFDMIRWIESDENMIKND